MMQLAKVVGDLATGQQRDEQRAAGAGPRKRGLARAAKLTPERRSEIARKAARVRWRGR